MSLSYSYACSQTVKSSTCFVCLSKLFHATCTDFFNPELQVVGLPQCKHLVHIGCFDHWSNHSKELARRDVSIVDQDTCPLCKARADKREDFQYLRGGIFLSEYEKTYKQAPDPLLPLPLLENTDPDSQYDSQSIQLLFDKAVSVDYSDCLFNVSNFPALHQIKNRYGITLSAGQLDKILNEALLAKSSTRQYLTIDMYTASKIKMAMLLRSDDEASKEVIHKFYTRILSVSGRWKNIIVDFLLNQIISDKKILQEGFDHYIKKGSFREAVEILEKHDLRIEYEALKKALMQVQSEFSCGILARIAAASDQDFQQVVRDAAKELNDSEVAVQDHSFRLIRDTIKTLMSTRFLDQTEINKSLRLAVLANDTDWQYMLHHEYGAVLEPQFLREHLESTDTSKLIRKVETLIKIKANDDVTTSALITALLRVVDKNNRPKKCFEIKNLLTKCWSEGIRSQQVANNALIQAIDTGEHIWAQALNTDFHAVLDAEALKNYLWKIVANPPSSTSNDAEQSFVRRVKSMLDFADKNSKQSNDAICFVLNGLFDNPSLSQKPMIKKCVELMVEFNSHSVSSPENKRQKIS